MFLSAFYHSLSFKCTAYLHSLVGDLKDRPSCHIIIKCVTEEVGEREAETAIVGARKYCIDCSLAN